jgi:hypothetical protein
LRKQDGDNFCYVRFRGTQKEEFFCDEQLEREKRQDLERFRLGDNLTTEEARQLSLSTYPPHTREEIQKKREKYLEELDRQYNVLHIDSKKGYSDRFLENKDLVAGSALISSLYISSIAPLLKEEIKR